MYCLHYCKKINNHFYNEKINKKYMEKLCNDFSLYKKYKHIKEYWINNVQIIIKDNILKFNYINDKNINYKDNFLIQEYEIKKCISFNFYDIDIESEYHLYENDNGHIKMKEYKDYITIEIYMDNLNNYDKKLYNHILNNIE